MKKYLKEHTGVKICMITILFLIGMALIIAGWKMTGKMAGLGIMLLGLALLLVALFIYNKPYED